MSFRAFLRARQVYTAFFVGFGLLATGVVQLDLGIAHAGLQRGTLLYILLLGLVSLLLCLLIDYWRQAAFYRRLDEITGIESLDELGVLPAPATPEQQRFARAWGALYARMRAELAAEQAQGRRNIQLLSQWAHHMKTPVAVIDLELQQAARQNLPPEGAAVLESVAEENQRLKDSLQSLLNMVRLADFTGDFRVEPVDLVALVRRLVNEEKRAFITHRVYPKVELPDPDRLPPALLTVESDAKWLRFVLDQIVSNAIKYSGRTDGDGHVTFRWERDGADLVLTVEDDGIGILPEDLGRVFTPFYTGANGRDYPQSTGMGLYLAREACRRLGHGLSLTSVRGEGTRVCVRFQGRRSLFADLQAGLTRI